MNRLPFPCLAAPSPSLHAFLAACMLLAALAAEEETTTATPPGTPLNAPIRHVLVYSDQAIITRSSEVTLQKEIERLLIEGLPYGLVDDSVRVRLEGPAGPRLLNLEVAVVHKAEFLKEEARQASEELKKLNREAQAMGDRIGELDRKAAFLKALEVGALPNGKGEKAEPVPLRVNAWSSTLDTVVEGLQGIAEDRLKLEDQGDELESAITVARARAERLLSYETRSSKTVALEIRGAAGARALVEVSYLIPGPQWYPRYDVRADLSAGTVELSMDALVKQETGEDWSDAALEFSAAEPSRSANLPKLLAWHIDAAEAGEQVALEARRIDLSGATVGGEDLRGLRAQEEMSEKRVARQPAAPPPPPPEPAAKPQEAAQLEKRLQEAPAGQITSSGAGTVFVGGAVRGMGLSSTASSRAGKTKQKLQKVQELYKQQSEALSKKDYQAYQSLNEALVQIDATPDREIRQVYGDLLQKAEANVQMAARLLEVQKLAAGVISPAQSSGGYDYKYRSVRIETIRSDGVFSKVSIARETVPAAFYYEIVPELARLAFLQATLKNPFRSPLLAGPTGIFLGNDFVAQGDIETTSSGEELKLGLGVDEGIVVSRVAESKRETTGLGGNRYSHQYVVTVKIRNDKNREVLVQVMERVPYSPSKEVVVRDERLDPQPSKTEKGGLKRWDLTVKPAEEKSIVVRYGVVHPSDTRLMPREDTNAARW